MELAALRQKEQVGHVIIVNLKHRRQDGMVCNANLRVNVCKIDNKSPILPPCGASIMCMYVYNLCRYEKHSWQYRACVIRTNH